MDGPGIESRWAVRFFAPVQTGPGAHPAACTKGTESPRGSGVVRQHTIVYFRCVRNAPKRIRCLFARNSDNAGRSFVKFCIVGGVKIKVKVKVKVMVKVKVKVKVKVR